MKISLAWLNTYLEKPVTADQAEDLLTGVGFPIESRQATAGGDMVLDVEVTSNRGDCLSHLGVAREVAAAAGMGVKLIDDALSVVADTAPVESLTSVTVEEPSLCPLYTARVIRGVKVGPSPAWLVERLAAVGVRSVNNVVDVTNFVLLEFGQPLHAFDMARLGQGRIVVRPAREGEPFTAIDGTKHQLKLGMLVIADAHKAVAIAGVMGGLDSEVSPRTVDILLESAIFAPMTVRQTSRSLRLASDSSYRFERGVDPLGVERASRRAAQLMVEVAGGRIAQGVTRIGEPEPASRRITMRASRCTALLGYDLPPGRMMQLFTQLGLSPSADDESDDIICQAPTYRLDLHREVDLIEEIGRLNGYDACQVAARIAIVPRGVQAEVAAARRLREVMTAHGYCETVTFSFVQPRQGELFVPAGTQPVMMDDERRKKEPMLRPSLLPSLLACRKANQDAGNSGVRLFETAATWGRRGPAIDETRRLALLMDVREDGASASAEQSLRELRGTVNELCQRLAGVEVTFEPVEVPYLVNAAAVRLRGETLGVVGQVSAQVLKTFELLAPVAVGELELAPLLSAYPPKRMTQALARFPAIERDLSVVVDEAVSWSRITAAVAAVQAALLEEVRFVTMYRGKPVPAGQKSVTMRLVFRDPQATLRHEQVDPQVAAVVERLGQALGAQLRA
ncbi:MAG: phenylalanine--tRNA ligase subunit beta [Phycisphaeraceae bacterium]